MTHQKLAGCRLSCSHGTHVVAGRKVAGRKVARLISPMHEDVATEDAAQLLATDEAPAVLVVEALHDALVGMITV